MRVLCCSRPKPALQMLCDLDRALYAFDCCSESLVDDIGFRAIIIITEEQIFIVIYNHTCAEFVILLKRNLLKELYLCISFVLSSHLCIIKLRALLACLYYIFTKRYEPTFKRIKYLIYARWYFRTLWIHFLYIDIRYIAIIFRQLSECFCNTSYLRKWLYSLLRISSIS